jgi:excinuclease UvrABC nuclease subunit
MYTLADVPYVPGVYVVYGKNRRVQYVGSSVNLHLRLYAHKQSHSSVGKLVNDRNCPVKYRPCVRFGDWLMVELRLIKRLRPPLNQQGNRSGRVRPAKATVYRDGNRIMSIPMA